MTEAVLFDALGTLFDLGPRGRSAELMRTLHHATSLTPAGEFAPLSELARAVDPDLARGPEGRKGGRRCRGGAGRARRCRPAGVRTCSRTAEATRTLLRNGGLEHRISDVFSVDDVRRYKPDPAPYAHAARRIGLEPARITLVAAHGWDVVGARKAGLETVWVDREDEGWPLPLEPPAHRAGDLLAAVQLATATRR